MIQIIGSGETVFPLVDRTSTTFTVRFVLPDPTDVSGYIALCTNVGA